MGTAIALWNIIGKAKDVFLVGIVPLHRQFHTHPVLLAAEVKDRGVQRRLLAVQVCHKGLDAPLVLKDIFLVRALIG